MCKVFVHKQYLCPGQFFVDSLFIGCVFGLGKGGFILLYCVYVALSLHGLIAQLDTGWHDAAIGKKKEDDEREEESIPE